MPKDEHTFQTRREEYLERSLPHSEDSERCILGGILLDNNLMLQVIGKLVPRHFYSPLNRRIFEAMVRMYQAGTPIDPILVIEEMKKDGPVDAVGGVSTVANLTYGIPHFSDLGEYIKTVFDAAKARKLIRLCNDTVSDLLAQDTDVSEILDTHEQLVYELRSQGKDHADFTPLGVTAMESVNILKQHRQSGGRAMLGIPTKLKDLDYKLSGLQKGDLIIVAARPSMGKTALALTFAQNTTADDFNRVVAIFSLEMPKIQLANRLIASEAKADSMRFRQAMMTSDEWLRVDYAVDQANQRHIYIDDSSRMNTLEIRGKSRRLLAEQGRLDLIIVDYLQLLKPVTYNKNQSRHLELSEMTKDLKAIAKDLMVPTIALSQMSRAPEVRKPPRPLMSDLRESGAIEEDADVVAMIYREEYYNAKDDNKGIAEIIVGKNRNGPTGTVKVAFLEQFARFENLYER